MRFILRALLAWWRGLKQPRRLRVGVIGPTNISMLAQFLRRPVSGVEEVGRAIGRALAEAGVELWAVADRGMLYTIAQSYKEYGGPKLVMLLPYRWTAEWSIEHAKRYVGIADKVIRSLRWVETNRKVVTIPEVVICAGLSSGTASELAYIRWNIELKPSRGNLRTLLVIRELLRERRFPPEHSYVLTSVLRYVDCVAELREALEEHRGA